MPGLTWAFTVRDKKTRELIARGMEYWREEMAAALAVRFFDT